MKIPVSLIIPCSGRPDWLELCLQGVVQLNPAPAEIFVVDSADREDIRRVVARFGHVTLIAGEAGRLLSAGEARNRGVRFSKEAWLAFLDADCVPVPEWLAQLDEYQMVDAQMASGPVLNLFPEKAISVVDNLLQFVDMNQSRKPGPVSHALTCNMLVRRDVFEAAGGFSAIFPIEDHVFSIEVIEKGGAHAIFHPGQQVKHAGRDTWQGFVDHQYSFGYARAKHGILISEKQLWLAKNPLLILPVATRRLVYIYYRLLYWRTFRLQHVLYLPLVFAGLVTWAYGFWRGSQDYFHRRRKNA